MFTAEVDDEVIRRKDGPHQTLRWRKKVRHFKERQELRKARRMREAEAQTAVP